MADKIRIKINKPCGESWSGMEPTQEGRYCSACSKEVVDFTGYTDKQLLDFFSRQSGQLCGRLRKDQLRQYPVQAVPSAKLPAIRAFLAAAVAFVVPVVANANGASHLTSPVHQTESETKNPTMPKGSLRSEPDSVTIRGRVLDGDTKETLPGATIKVKGKDTKVISDMDGLFQLTVFKSDSAHLEIGFIGYMMKDIRVAVKEQSSIELSEISLEPDTQQLGGIVMIGATEVNPVKSLWWRIKNIFR